MSLTSSRRRTYLIQEPSSDYALQFITQIFVSFGLRPVCFYTNPKERYYAEQEHPILRSSVIEAAYDVTDLRTFAAEIRQRYEVLAVIPHIEPLVETAAVLCRLLDIDWNPPERLRMFRDKIALKRHLAEAGVRVPSFRSIESAQELDRRALPDKFVVKPVDGYGNRMIGVFTSGELDAAKSHVGHQPDVRWMLEEFVSGTEFSINGQVRSGGEVEVHGITEYRRRSIGGFHTVYDHEFLCPSSHPHFAVLADFAGAVLGATGVRRTPFHMEAIVDEHGPTVIDLAARLGGCGMVNMLSRAHPEMPDVLSIAAHDYLGTNRFALGAVKWDRHDALLSMQIFGLAEHAAVIHSLAGIEEIEAMPEFIGWITKPAVGDRIFPTDHLHSSPFILDVWAPADEAERLALVERVRAAIRWNDEPSATAERLALVRRKASGTLRRARWLLHRFLMSRGK